jgi:hypothetical protein
MIGDFLDADIQGALEIGLDAIFFNESNVEVVNSIKTSKSFIRTKKIFIIMKEELLFLHYEFQVFAIC